MVLSHSWSQRVMCRDGCPVLHVPIPFCDDSLQSLMMIIYSRKSAGTKCLLFSTPQKKQCLSCLGRLQEHEYYKTYCFPRRIFLQFRSFQNFPQRKVSYKIKTESATARFLIHIGVQVFLSQEHSK